jgi:hypothetical protein
VSSGNLGINSLGIAEWQPPVALPIGSNSISASYSGDASFAPSASAAPLNLTITRATPQLWLISQFNAIALGSPDNLSTSVLLSSGPNCDPNFAACTYQRISAAVPTGTLTYSVAGTVLASVTLNAQGYAILNNVTSLPLGNDTVTASYSGDANYAPASATTTVSVGLVPNITAVPNPSTVNQADYTAITASLSGPSGVSIPTGSVSYSASGPGSGWNDTEKLVNGVATSSALPGGIFMPGSASVAVTYNGDANYGPYTITAPLTVVSGTVPPFTLAATPVSILPGATTGNTSTITVTPQGGFIGTVYFSCSLTTTPTSAAYLPTCAIPSSMAFTGSSAAALIMTISSTAPSTSAAALASYQAPRIPPAAWALVALLLWGALFLRAMRRGALVAGALGALICLTCCGGGGSNKGGGGQVSPGTTPGSYTFTVQAAFSSGGVTKTKVSVPVMVQ